VDQQELTLTQDTFLRVLGLSAVEQGLDGAAQRAALYALASDYLRQRGEVAKLEIPNVPPGVMAMLVPRTSFHVRLSGPVQDEIKEILVVGAYILGGGKLDPQALTLVGVMALVTRLRKLNVDYGERSIVDTLGEVSEKSARRVMLKLYGKACRYPLSKCRYRNPDDEHCAITLEQTQTTLDDLVNRGILRRPKVTEPVEYSVVF
jgi:hypothetical protein